MNKVDSVLKKIMDQYDEYIKERNSENGIIDMSVVCDLAESIPYLVMTIENQREYIGQLEHEKQLLYGRLNMLRDLIDKEIK